MAADTADDAAEVAADAADEATDDATDAAIPGRDFTFSQLKHAQADGDLLTLHRHGLRACRTTLAELTAHVDLPGGRR